jgi:hypothetical protein
MVGSVITLDCSDDVKATIEERVTFKIQKPRVKKSNNNNDQD